MADLNTILNLDEFFVAQKMISISNRYLVTDTANNILLYSKQKLFKIKEEYRFYFDEKETQEALTIKAQNIIDFGATYLIIDPTTNQTIGSIKERVRSLIRGAWKIFSASGDELATVEEDSTFLAVLRRVIDFISYLIPVNFTLIKDGSAIGEIMKKRTVFRDRYYIDMRKDSNKSIDRRLVISLAVLLDSINRQ